MRVDKVAAAAVVPGQWGYGILEIKLPGILFFPFFFLACPVIVCVSQKRKILQDKHIQIIYYESPLGICFFTLELQLSKKRLASSVKLPVLVLRLYRCLLLFLLDTL